jgi:nicotinamide-nucleotide amidase
VARSADIVIAASCSCRLFWRCRQFNVSTMTTNTISTNDAQLRQLAAQVGAHLLASRRLLVTAESCTGGWIGKAATDIAGSSAWFLGGAVVYSNALKQRVLGVTEETLARSGAVSEQAVRAMAEGALAQLGGDVAIAVSGIAGPDGGTLDKPVGTVWFAWSWRKEGQIETTADRRLFSGDRELVRRQTVVHALERVLAL